jgi:hypothetical protein
MKTKQKRFIFILIGFMGFACIAALVWNYFRDLNSPGKQALIKAKSQPACRPVDPKTIGQIAAFQADIAHWQTYRNAQYGFEIKYPGVPRYRIGQNTTCGDQLGDFFDATTAIDKNEDADQKAKDGYDITVYANPQNLAPKDYFLCKMKDLRGDNFNESVIKSIGNIVVGKQKNSGTKIVLDNLNEEIMIPSGGNIIDIAWSKGEGNQSQPKELDQMLSTFKLAPQNNYRGFAKFEIVEPPDQVRTSYNAFGYGKDYDIGYYWPGTKAVAYADGMDRVEFRQRGPHAGSYTDPEGFLVGMGTKAVDNDGKEKWEMILPSNNNYSFFADHGGDKCFFDELCALGYDAQGKKVGEYCLYDVYEFFAGG